MTMECSLIYVSRVEIDRERMDDEIASIIAWADHYNSTVGITGGLVRAQGWFAQLLEGSTEAVGTLMTKIKRDQRHSDVTVLRVTAQRTRRLGRWSLAYAGDWHYMADIIGNLIDPSILSDQHDIDYLEQTIVDFASA